MKAKRTVSSQKILEGMKTKVIASFSFDHKKKRTQRETNDCQSIVLEQTQNKQQKSNLERRYQLI
jgi:hypothetical protein